MCKKYIALRKTIKKEESKNTFEYTNLFNMINKKTPIINNYPNICFYCKHVYYVTHNNMYCSKDCKNNV